MKKLEEVKLLRKNVSGIRDFFDIRLPKFKADSRIDKLIAIIREKP